MNYKIGQMLTDFERVGIIIEIDPTSSLTSNRCYKVKWAGYDITDRIGSDQARSFVNNWYHLLEWS